MAAGLKLFFRNERVSAINVDTVIGNALLKKFGDEAKYVSSKQFKIFRDAGTGQWSISHEPSAQNETLLNGNKLTGTAELTNGDEITVGNSSKGIKKMPLTVKLDIESVPETTVIPVVAPVATPSIESPTISLTHDSDVTPTPTRLMDSPIVKGLGKVGGVLMTVAGGILKGMAGGMAYGGFGANAALVRRGNSMFGEVILNIKDNHVRQGSSMFGDVLMTINGEKIHRGSSMFGDVIANVDGDRVVSGYTMFGDVIAKIDGNKVVRGNSIFGEVLATVENGGRMSAAAAAVYLLLM